MDDDDRDGPAVWTPDADPSEIPWRGASEPERHVLTFTPSPACPCADCRAVHDPEGDDDGR